VRLEGSLDAFSLPDIFQLLSFTKKTGGLHLRRDSDNAAHHGVVYVTTGSLTGGSSDVRRQGLARRLVGAGVVDDEALSQAVNVAVDSEDIGVARALQQAGAVDEGALHESATEHVIDTVFDLMRWADGGFVFVVDETNPDDVGVSVSVEDAVAEARRRLEGWGQVSTTVPSPDAVLAVGLTPQDDPAFSREEWALLALVDGRRVVSDVVAATGRGEFAVVSMLASLVDRGLLVVTGEAEQPAVNALLRRLSSLAVLEGHAPDLDPAEPEVDNATDVVETRETSEAVDTAEVVHSERAVAEDYVAEVIPPRAEPFLPRRRPDHLDDDFAPVGAGSMPRVVGQIDGTAAVATEPIPSGLIERDPSVNKSLLLRLIAGVRGL
jgi:hypothetical protein